MRKRTVPCIDMKPDKKTSLQQIAIGRPTDFRLIYRTHGESVKRMVCRLVAQREDSEELVQNTFVNVFTHLADFNPKRASMQTWIMRIAINEVRMYFRRKKSATISLDDTKGVEHLGDDKQTDHLLDNETPERVTLLRQAVAQLPSDDQILLHLFYTDQQPLSAISSLLDAKPNQLAKRLQRIRQKLATMILNMEEHEDQ